MKIIIDGYNLLHAYYTGFSPQDPQAVDSLIESLRKYKRIKAADITVYFDGTYGGKSPSERSTQKGIKIVFTRLGRTADQDICSHVAKNGEGYIVVSSDRSVKEGVEAAGAVCVASDYFAGRLQAALLKEIKGEDENIYRDKPSKGPSRRKKKKDRKKDRMIPKL